MSSTDSHNWKTEEEIRREEFCEGYDQEAAPAGLRPDERNDGRDSELKHTHVEGTTSETTMYATPDNSPKQYDPNESLTDCERFSSRGAKYTRLWELNAGRDNHTVAGKTYKDGEIHKVNQPARERARFVHAVANEVELPRSVVDRSTSLARRLDPRAYNYWGGMDVFILAVVKYTADEHDWCLDRDAFEDIRNQWDVSSEDLTAAIEKMEEDAEMGE